MSPTIQPVVPAATEPAQSLPDAAPQAGADLRLRAEAVRQQHDGRSSDDFGRDIEPLLHDLHVHQIELELQNEELQRATAEAQDATARYQDLYDLAPIGYCSVSEVGLITQANLTLAHQLGTARSALVHQRFSTYVQHDSQDDWYRLKRRCLTSGEAHSWELGMQTSGQQPFWAQLTANALPDGQGAQELRLVLRDVSAIRRLHDDLRASEERYRLLAQDMPLFVSAWLPDGTLTYVNAALADIVGSTPEQLMGRNFLDFLSQDEQALAKVRLATLTPTNSTETHEQRMVAANGSQQTHEWTNRAFFDSAGHITHLQSVGQDITERKAAQDKLRLAAGVFTCALEGIMITDALGCIVDVNESFTRITGYLREEALGQNSRFLNSGRHGSDHFAAMWRDLIDQGHWVGEVWNRRKSGAVFVAMQTISAVRDSQGNVSQYVSLFSDITEHKSHQSHLEHLAHFDALTNLPNRLLLAGRLQQAMAQAQRRSNQLAVAYLDLDGFKDVNDNHGHDVGDKLLVSLTNALKACLREGDTLARIGGDEFVAVLADLDNVNSSVPMLMRLLAAAGAPVHLGERVLKSSASIGVTFYPQPVDVAPDQLLRQADQAMYQAKLAGKNRYHVFDTAQDSSLRGHFESLERIRLGLQQSEFVLHFQPKVNMRSGKVIGAEALIRWQHPQQGLLLPAAFLPVIENHLLSIEVGEWVIENALTQQACWHAAGLDLPVSVNVNARQLQQADFVLRLRAILAKHPHVSPTHLMMEVLETSALADMAQVSQVIEECAQMDVMFALDDFGTGYSSLTYLKRLHVTRIKIDQSFVHDMLDDADDLAILQGVIGLAAAFKREVIAEGVETIAHGTALLRLGCELGQGYGIARPMQPQQLPAWVAAWTAGPNPF